MKKTTTIFYIAQEALYQVSETLINAYNRTSTDAEAKDEIIAGADLVKTTIKSLNSDNTTKNVADITEALAKYKDVQGHSGLLTKIKEFIKSIIHFLKSKFTKRTEEELHKSKDDTIQTIVGITDDEATQKFAIIPPPSIESQKSSEILTEPKPRSSSISSLLPSVSINIPLPPSPPPAAPSKAHTFQLPGDRKALMEAIRGGVKLKNVAEGKSPNIPRTASQDPRAKVIDDLTRLLKERRKKLGDSHEVGAPASKFAEDAQLFEQARREEAERQARQEEIQNAKVKAAEAAEKDAQKAVAKQATNLPTPTNWKPGMMIPPPPPPPPLQTNNKVKFAPQTAKRSDMGKETGRRRGAASEEKLNALMEDIKQAVHKRQKKEKNITSANTNHQEEKTVSNSWQQSVHKSSSRRSSERRNR